MINEWIVFNRLNPNNKCQSDFDQNCISVSPREDPFSNVMLAEFLYTVNIKLYYGKFDYIER